MKIAVLHYWFITRRGGEKVVESILKLFPDADIYTLFYDEKTYGNHISNHKVYTSTLNTPFFTKYYQKFFPLYPFAVNSIKLRDDYDLIISSESGPIKGVKIPKRTPHICYIHSPMRYCWGFTEEYLKSVNIFIRPILKVLFKRLRNWDETTINNVDLYIANSENVSNRVKVFYHKESKVVYPPIADNLFLKELRYNKSKDVYLSFGAITPYKKVDLLVDTFNSNGEKLIIIGAGSETEKLRKKAKNNIFFKGELKWEDIEQILFRTKALLFPGEEDFGMIPLEVMAYGVPVIAFRKGGALETVVENENNIGESTGLFFNEQTIESLQNRLNYFEKIQHKFNSEWIKNHAEKFTEKEFLKKISFEINTFIKNKRIKT